MNTPADEQLAISKPGATAARFREATDAANVCKAIVMKTAVDISGRKYVKVEGWMSIAVAHGCIASIRSVTDTPKGVVAVAELRRGDLVLTTAEGYVGNDEPTWYGGLMKHWNKYKKCEEEKVLPKRADYAIRAMAQTRALSRVCRTAFAHVVVLMDAGLETVPAEEIDDPTLEPIDIGTAPEGHSDPQPIGGAMKAAAEALKKQVEAKAAEAGAKPAAATQQAPAAQQPAPAAKPIEVPRDEILALREQFRGNKWEQVAIHFGKNKNVKLAELAENQLGWYIKEWHPKPYNGVISEDDKMLRAALDVAGEETVQ